VKDDAQARENSAWSRRAAKFSLFKVSGFAATLKNSSTGVTQWRVYTWFEYPDRQFMHARTCARQS
jgi:hypothetical protein